MRLTLGQRPGVTDAKALPKSRRLIATCSRCVNNVVCGRMLLAHLDVEAGELVLGGLYSVASVVNRAVYSGVNKSTHACQECSVLLGLNPNILHDRSSWPRLEQPPPLQSVCLLVLSLCLRLGELWKHPCLAHQPIC